MMTNKSSPPYDSSQLSPNVLEEMGFPTQASIQEKIDELQRMQETVQKMAIFDFDWRSKGEVVGLLNFFTNPHGLEDYSAFDVEDYQPEPLKNPLVFSAVKIVPRSSSYTFNSNFDGGLLPDEEEEFQLVTTLVYDLTQFLIPREGRWFLFFPAEDSKYANNNKVAVFEYPDNKPIFAYVKSQSSFRYGRENKRFKDYSWKYSYDDIAYGKEPFYGNNINDFFLTHLHPNQLKKLTLRGRMDFKWDDGGREIVHDDFDLRLNAYTSTLGLGSQEIKRLKPKPKRGTHFAEDKIKDYLNLFRWTGNFEHQFELEEEVYDEETEDWVMKPNPYLYDKEIEGSKWTSCDTAYPTFPFLGKLKFKDRYGSTWECKSKLTISTPSTVEVWRGLQELNDNLAPMTSDEWSHVDSRQIAFTGIWACPLHTYVLTGDSITELPQSTSLKFGGMEELFGVANLGRWRYLNKSRDSWKNRRWERNARGQLDVVKLARLAKELVDDSPNSNQAPYLTRTYNLPEFMEMFGVSKNIYEVGVSPGHVMNLKNPYVYQSKESVGLLNFRVL